MRETRPQPGRNLAQVSVTTYGYLAQVTAGFLVTIRNPAATEPRLRVTTHENSSRVAAELRATNVTQP